MFSHSFHSKEQNLKRFLSSTLIALVLLAGSPAPFALADDDNSTGSAGGGGAAEGGASISTGDASSGSDASNDVNNTHVDTNAPADDEEEAPAEEEPSGEEVNGNVDVENSNLTPEEQAALDQTQGENIEGGEEPQGPDASELPPGTTAVTTDNTASTTNNVLSGAQTGQNTITASSTTATSTATSTASTTPEQLGETGTALIETGNAEAFANVINVVNTVSIDSYGLLYLYNMLFGLGNLDLRDFFLAPEELPAGEGCSLGGCDNPNVSYSVTSTSTADVVNNVVVRAGTGENVAEGDGGASIFTGDAYAGANVVNVVNSNFINTNYLLMAINNFGSIVGDIILPAQEYFMNLLSPALGAGGNTTISTNNEASVSNNATTTAETGNNTASSTGDGTDGGTIVTGDAASGTNVLNQINTNAINSDSLYILFRVHGSWSGEIFGLPEGITWRQTPLGIEIFNEGLFGGESAECCTGGDTNINTTNSASVENNVDVYALTGENEATGGGAYINTGNAAAGANIINVVNTNVIGRNWIFAIFNIFGDWNGNLAFGQPDLWIGLRAESDDEVIRGGSEVTYHYTVANNGDADATNVKIKNDFDDGFLTFLSDDEGEDGDTVWDIGTVKAGETVEVAYTALIASEEVLPGGNNPIVVTSNVSSRESDAHADDNTEQIVVVATKEIARQSSSEERRKREATGEENLEITKTVHADSATASSTVDYTIKIKNNGDIVFDALLHDVLRDIEGEVMHEEVWDLGKIYADEEITVEYSVFFSSETLPGLYNNEAYIDGFSHPTDDNKHFISEKSSASIEILPHEELELLNVRVTETTVEDGSGIAIVEWETNIPATSKVVYGPSDIEYAFTDEEPLYGYPFATLEDLEKTTTHRVVVEGLDPGETYKYRAVSKASPAKASEEQFFTIAELVAFVPQVAGAFVEPEIAEAAPLIANASSLTGTPSLAGGPAWLAFLRSDFFLGFLWLVLVLAMLWYMHERRRIAQ